jgi:hypothetical protein
MNTILESKSLFALRAGILFSGVAFATTTLGSTYTQGVGAPPNPSVAPSYLSGTTATSATNQTPANGAIINGVNGFNNFNSGLTTPPGVSPAVPAPGAAMDGPGLFSPFAGTSPFPANQPQRAPPPRFSTGPAPTASPQAVPSPVAF